MLFNLYKIFKSLSRVERLIIAGALLIFAVSAAIYAISFIEKVTRVVPAYGGTYREGIVSQPVYLNPVISASNDADKDIMSLVYSNLKDLSEKITLSGDKTAWTVRLKDNLIWHDGAQLTSDDIIFTIDKIQDPEAHSPLAIIWQGVKTERKSERELVIRTGAPYGYFEDNLKNLYIVPKHIFEGVPVANWQRSDYMLEPIGSGPYKYASYKRERNGFISEYQLKRNESYFGERPYIQNIVFSFFTDESSAVQAFNTARIDALAIADVDNLASIRRPYELKNMRLPRYYAIFFNQDTNDLLKNKVVRQALSYAIDKKSIIEKIWNGLAAEVDSPSPSGKSINPEAAYDYDRARAESLLAGAKLKKDNNGYYGEIKLVVPQLKFLVDTANMVKTDWEAVGVKTDLIVLDSASISNDVIKTRNYEALIFGNIFANNGDMFSFWHSSERFYPGLNLSLYNNKSVDKLLERARSDFDENNREAEIDSLSSTIADDAPAAFLYSPNYFWAVDSKVRGLEENVISAPARRFTDIAKWYIETKRVWK